MFLKQHKKEILTEEEKEYIKDVYLLTAKPILYIANVSEEQLNKTDSDEYVQQVKEKD